MIDEELRKLAPRPYMPLTLYIAVIAAIVAYAVDEISWRVHLHSLPVELSILYLVLIFLGTLLLGLFLVKSPPLCSWLAHFLF